MTSHTDSDQLGGFERRLLAALTRVDAQRQPAPLQAPVPPREPHRNARRLRLRRMLLALAVLAGLLALTTTAVATLSSHADLAVGGDAPPGGVAVAKGAGCRVGGAVTFTLDGKSRLGVAKADAEGLFVAELPIPSATPLGWHELTATCTGADGKRLVQPAKLRIAEPEPEPAPEPFLVVYGAPPGGVAVAKGAGCRVGGAVTFTLDGRTRLGVAKAGGQGVFATELRIPSATPLGWHELTATCTGADGKRLVQPAKLRIAKPEPEPLPGQKPALKG